MTSPTPSLFDAPALARRSDPRTSHGAAKEVTRSGKAASQRALVLSVVLAHPGLTAAEVAVSAGLERHDPSRRLPELRRQGLVANGVERVCQVTGFLSLTWWPSREPSATPAAITPAAEPEILENEVQKPFQQSFNFNAVPKAKASER